MTDDGVKLDVMEELVWDPKIDSSAIAVSVDDGIVTLKGTVGSFREKRDAGKTAQRVWGVKSVANDLDVRLLTEHQRDDADVRGSVIQALMLDSVVPSTIDAHVDGAVVTLTGTAEWHYQRDEAEKVAGSIEGVVEVDDHVELVGPPPDAGAIEGSIKHAFKRNAKLDADGVSVESKNGTVTLSGVVSSWTEHDEALDAAWAAPGVTKVDDHLAVDY